MQEFHVPPGLFADKFPDLDHAPYRQAIGELIDRYGIRDKRVLALGGGSAFEERWFAELGGNALTIVDIDEHGSAEGVLRAAAPGPMRYIVGDALQVDPGPHDVLYASGFTPDEVRRGGIAGSSRRHWPLWRSPFHPILLRNARHLTAGGLMIVQSMYHSLDARRRWNYLRACRLHLALHGMRLVEVYRFAHTVGVMLYVAQKRGGPPPPLRRPLTRFHVRAAREPIERIYP